MKRNSCTRSISFLFILSLLFFASLMVSNVYASETSLITPSGDSDQLIADPSGSLPLIIKETSSTPTEVTGPSKEWLKLIYPEGGVHTQTHTSSSDKLYILNSSDGGYFVVGNNENYSGIFIIKADSAGIVQAQYRREADVQQRIYVNAATLCSDGSITIVGRKLKEDEWSGEGTLLLNMKFKEDPENGKFVVDQDSIKEKSFNSTNTLLSIDQTKDGGFILAGYNHRYFTQEELNTSEWARRFGDYWSYAHFYLMRVDSQFNMVWEKTYFDDCTGETRSVQSFAQSVKQTSDGGFIVSGQGGHYYWNNDYGNGDCLFKINSLGEILWVSFLNQNNGALFGPQAILETKDGDFVSTTYSNEQQGGGLVKYDFYGNKLWEHYYSPGIDSTLVPWALLEAEDGGYILVGVSFDSAAIPDTYLMKVDGSGTLIWERHGLTDELKNYKNAALSIVFSDDGGIMEAGHIETPPTTMAPTATLAGGIVTNGTVVNLTTASSGATIHYTLNGHDPDTDSPSGTSVTINGAVGTTVTLKAYAVQDGMMESDIVTFTYTIASPETPNKVAAPTATVAGGIVPNCTDVILGTTTSGATIYFTVDGSSPINSPLSGTSATISGEVGTTVTLKAYAIQEGRVDSDIATFTYTIETPHAQAGKNSVFLLKLKSPIDVKVSPTYKSQERTLDIKATANCYEVANDSTLTNENTLTASFQVVDAEGQPLGISGNLIWNQGTMQWEALNIDLSQMTSQAATVKVSFEDTHHHIGTDKSEIYASAELGLSSYNVMPNGNVLVYATLKAINNGRDTLGKANLSVRIAGSDEKFRLFDTGDFGDLAPNDGEYSRELHIPGKIPAIIELYLGDEMVDSEIVNVISKPELAVITDFDALYAQFKDIGMGPGEDIDKNGIVDFYDLLECVAQYAKEYNGVVFNLDQEIVSSKGYDDYNTLIYGVHTIKMAKNIDRLINRISTSKSIKNVAIIGDDEVVPFFRRIDPTLNIANDGKCWEEDYYNDVHGGGENPTILDSKKGFIMTDVPYGSYDNISPDLYSRPTLDAAVGRVFADRPLQLKTVINGYNNPIQLNNAAIFQMQNDTVNWDTSVNLTLIPGLISNYMMGDVNVPGFQSDRYYIYNPLNCPDGWTPTDITTALQNVDLNMLWTHANHMVADTFKGTSLNATDHLSSMNDSPGHVLISTGCHSGYSTSYSSPEGNYISYNNSLVKSLIAKQVSYIAPTVYGIGFDNQVGYHDLILQRFMENLLDTSTASVGEAQIKAYQEYWQRIQPEFKDFFNVYSAYGTGYYGLPTQPIVRLGGFHTTATDRTFLYESSPVSETIVIDPEFQVTELPDGKKVFEVLNEGDYNLQAFAPVMPLIIRKIELPGDTVVSQVNLSRFTTSDYTGGVDLPTAVPVRKSTGSVVGTYDLPDTYPEKIYWWETYKEGDRLQLVLSVIPMQYREDSKGVTLYNHLEFEIVTSTDELWAWGNNFNGQLGDGTTENRIIPTRIGSEKGWIAVTAGGTRTLALKGDGTLWIWGDDSSGESKMIPTQIGSDSDWIAVTAGSSHNVALKADGSLWTWGFNWYGELGDGTTIEKREPTQISSYSDWIAAAAGDGHTMALRADGSLWGWGDNWRGQLGDGTTESKTTPTRIGSDSNWTAVAAGNGHTIALKSDGSLWGWGDNWNGQLGDSIKEERTTPTQIGSETNWARVFAKDMKSFSLKTDGTLWGWGGDGMTESNTIPTQIGSESDWKEVAIGFSHTMALKVDGSLWGWGNNWNGELGDGTTESKTTPTRIGSDSNWTAVAAGSQHTVALKGQVGYTATPVVQIGINPNAGDGAGIFVGLKDIKNAEGHEEPNAKISRYEIELVYDNNQTRLLNVVDEANIGQIILDNPQNIRKVSVVDIVDQGTSNYEKLFFVPLALIGTSNHPITVTVKFTSLNDIDLNPIKVFDSTLTFQRGKILNEANNEQLTLLDAIAGLQYLAKIVGFGTDTGEVNVINMSSIIPPEEGATSIKPNVKDVIALMQYLVGLRDDTFQLVSESH